MKEKRNSVKKAIKNTLTAFFFITCAAGCAGALADRLSVEVHAAQYEVTGKDNRNRKKDYTYAHGYYYDFLDEKEKEVYDAIVESCESGTKRFEFIPVNLNLFRAALDAVRFDHPEFYWLHNGMTSWHNSEGKTYRADNDIPKDAADNLAYMNSIADQIAAEVAGFPNDYDKYRYIYDYINGITTYGRAEGVDDQAITSVLMHGISVCTGYADTFKFLCDRAGLFCIRVVGKTYDWDGNLSPGTHSWNMIRVEGSYYWADVTWADTNSEKAAREGRWYQDPNYYAYLCATDGNFLKDHLVSTRLLSEDPGHFQAWYPACCNEQYTTYSLMDLQFGCTEDAYGYIVNNLADGIPYVWMQFGTTDEMYRAIDILHNGGHIWNLVNNSGRYYSQYYYYYDWRFNTLVFEFSC